MLTRRAKGKAQTRACRRQEGRHLKEQIVEIISDSGEGAQRCGQSLGAIAAKTGNGVWTVEIIPAEIRPPARSVAGASGNRIRIGSKQVTNGGDETDLVVAFNEQVLLGRVRAGELKQGCIILLESMWREDRNPKVVKSYVETHDQLVKAGYRVYEVPLERECRTLVTDPRNGKNMFALGMLCSIYSLDLQLGREQIAITFGKKDQRSSRANGAARGRLRLGRDQSRLQVCAFRPTRATSRRSSSTATPRWRSACSPRAWKSARCIRSRRRPRRRIISATVREGRRHRASGRGRDRRLRLRDRRLLCRQMHGDDHLGPGLFAQAGGDRARGDGRDPARRRQRAARRSLDRPADQGRAGRSDDRDASAAMATRPRS